MYSLFSACKPVRLDLSCAVWASFGLSLAGHALANWPRWANLARLAWLPSWPGWAPGPPRGILQGIPRGDPPGGSPWGSPRGIPRENLPEDPPGGARGPNRANRAAGPTGPGWANRARLLTSTQSIRLDALGVDSREILIHFSTRIEVKVRSVIWRAQSLSQKVSAFAV